MPEGFLRHHITILLVELFDRRFHEFQALEAQFALFVTPFAMDADCISEDLQMEIVDL